MAGTCDFGYVHVGARYYDPAVGRFLQRDPIGLFGGFNVYAYCANNPVSHVDPTGRLSFVDVVKTGGWQAALVGGAANSAKYALTQLLSSQRISPGVLVAHFIAGALSAAGGYIGAGVGQTTGVLVASAANGIGGLVQGIAQGDSGWHLLTSVLIDIVAGYGLEELEKRVNCWGR
ncbi:MAG: RHS repeat-associated core domain-containing protein [Phycisphaerales bacterium]|nr:RHS repeat-associated core domain-containing protein [Phycisphaerales bacterium]